MITSYQIRAARALLGIDQRALGELAGISLPTIQRMESSGGQVRGVVDTLVKVIAALEGAGVELLGDNGSSAGIGRGVRLRESTPAPGQTRRLHLIFNRPAEIVTGEDAH
ncbi:helix-turn-helix domain-containing protein [Sphingobium indicum]|uniref:helix-turn-helix domain-containing protein n=1 Tax=Sphingobium indicum TaxID=332055 RepID=UPI000569434E|nr:helix-turn-helix transcriptional regulator [Sphingobium indicum]